MHQITVKKKSAHSRTHTHTHTHTHPHDAQAHNGHSENVQGIKGAMTGSAMLQQIENNLNQKYGPQQGMHPRHRIPVSDQDSPPTLPGGRSYPSKSVFSAKGGTTTFNPKWFAKHKKDYGNPKKASLYIGIYFLLCFLVLLFLCIFEQLFSSQINIFSNKNENTDGIITDLPGFFSHLQITETGFIVMCYVPFIVALIFTCRIWNISESWKIKQEILYIFMVTAGNFFMTYFFNIHRIFA